MQHLRLEAMICNISVSVGGGVGKVTHLTDSYDVPHLQPPPSSNTHIKALKTRPESTVILYKNI